MLLRAFTLSILCGAVFFGDLVGRQLPDGEQAPTAALHGGGRAQGARRRRLYCTKNAKCGSCAQWTCGKSDLIGPDAFPAAALRTAGRPA